MTGTTASIAGLSDATAYTFSVAASNAGGTGEAVPIRVTAGTPAAVDNLRVDAAMATVVHLSWDASATGGTPTGYSVAGGGTAVVDGTRARITGLDAGTAYTFSVTAANDAGSSPVAAVAATAPVDDDLPGAVGDLRAVAVDSTAARLAWAAPYTGGSPTSYAVAGGGTATVSGTAASIAGLTDGGSYTFYVTGSNPVGTGRGVEDRPRDRHARYCRRTDGRRQDGLHGGSVVDGAVDGRHAHRLQRQRGRRAARVARHARADRRARRGHGVHVQRKCVQRRRFGHGRDGQRDHRVDRGGTGVGARRARQRGERRRGACDVGDSANGPVRRRCTPSAAAARRR